MEAQAHDEADHWLRLRVRAACWCGVTGGGMRSTRGRARTHKGARANRHTRRVEQCAHAHARTQSA
eukprot:12077381-Alexandrium_andersonii.AAC.1